MDRLVGLRKRLRVDSRPVDAAGGGYEERKVVEKPAFEVGPGRVVDQPNGFGRAEQNMFGLETNRVAPEPAVAGEHGQAPAFGLHYGEEAIPLLVVGQGQPAPGEALGRLRAEDHVDVLVAGPPQRNLIHEVGGQPTGDDVDGGCEPLEGGAKRPLPATVDRVRALGSPAQHAVVTAPRGPLEDLRGWECAGRRPAHDLPDGGDVEASVGQVRAGLNQPGEEEVAELLVMAVELAVRGDQGHARRSVGEARAGQAGQDPLPGEGVRVYRRVRFERGRRRKRGVVEDDDDRLSVSELHAVRTARVQAWACGLPRCQDRVADALFGQDAQRWQVHGGLGQPEAAGPSAEAQLEVAQAPADLGPPVRKRSEREDGVVVGLCHGVAAFGLVETVRQVRVHEAFVGRGVLGRQPARQRGPQVVRDVAEVAPLGVGLVALGIDPSVPVTIRGCGRLSGDLAGERVAALRLVEVAVDGELRATHSADGSGVAAAGEAPGADSHGALVRRGREARPSRVPRVTRARPPCDRSFGPPRTGR